MNNKISNFDVANSTAEQKKEFYKYIKIDDIIEYCQETNNVEWLKEIIKIKVPYKVHPRVKGPDGKKYVDKKAEPTIEEREISFVQLKAAFARKFIPEIAPNETKPQKISMYERIKNL